MLSPGYWLYRAALTWRSRMEASLSPLGLTYTQFMLLAATGWLEHIGGPPTQQRVADEAGVDRQMTSRVIRTLQERGLVARDAHETHGRALRLSLTEAGRTLTGQAVEIVRGLDEQVFGADPATLRAELRAIAELPPPPE
ncbi:DNA-binding transcriptional regulator, MarR family [Nonomuraea jiangxiensis]|uniref:DNA-binding transcriptional regulator, MarR family n=2 Tax=Nonomuraea jiangxiensis TaxID=633440 RepID=A0A1G8BPH6_9ACTN|nr:DNA-binding transcriptional regulator, MarR family [Nonomuraea jiangxiensis]